jgi:hypothetical protein
MMVRLGIRVLAVALALLPFTQLDIAHAQEPRLAGRLPDAERAQVERILNDARAAGLPTEPLIDRALEGAAKRAPANLIVAAVARLGEELRSVREAFGEAASPAELAAGASALRAGARPEDLARLRALRPEQPLTMAVAVLADLVAAGVPADTSVSAVLALAPTTADADYVAFRRNVERDIALGASPAASIGARLQAVADMAGAPNLETGSAGPGSTPRKRKP